MRCYNGCPDDELAAVWKTEDGVRASLKAAGLHATYFPMEGKWMVSVLGQPWCEVTGFHHTLVAAANAAYEKTCPNGHDLSALDAAMWEAVEKCSDKIDVSGDDGRDWPEPDEDAGHRWDDARGYRD